MFLMVPTLTVMVYTQLRVSAASPLRFVFRVLIKHFFYLNLQLMSQYSTIDISVVTTTFIRTESNVSGKRQRETRYVELP